MQALFFPDSKFMRLMGRAAGWPKQPEEGQNDEEVL